jgi:hypothetical protein
MTMSGRRRPGVDPTDEDLARLHLRTGVVALARAELEALAAGGPLDPPALADLAEARWRTGDLAGAAEAASLHLESGGDALVALVIAAESHAAAGRDDTAAAAVARAVTRAPGDLDAIFRGLERHAAWPGTASGGGAAGTPADEPASAADALDAARAALLEGRPAEAAIRLSLVLRADPELAPAVLAAIGTRPGAALDLVRGDAYRIIGRESDAAAAWEAAAAELRPARGLGRRSVGRRR